LIHIVMDQFEITISMDNYLLYVIIIMLIYGIKIIRKMPIFLTDIRTSSLRIKEKRSWPWNSPPGQPEVKQRVRPSCDVAIGERW
jgi:hypothetical protein